MPQIYLLLDGGFYNAPKMSDNKETTTLTSTINENDPEEEKLYKEMKSAQMWTGMSDEQIAHHIKVFKEKRQDGSRAKAD